MTNYLQTLYDRFNPKYFKANGTGTDADPLVPVHDVFIQDQSTESINFYICREDGATTTDAAIAVDDTAASVVSATGAAVGNCIDILDDSHMFQGLITAIDGTDITFTPKCDYAFASGATVHFGEWDLAQSDGSSTPETFAIHAPSGVSWDIYEIRINMTDASAMDESTFGGLVALTNGFVGRHVNVITKNLFLVTNNAGFYEQGFTTDYPSKVPAGVYAFRGIKNYKTVCGVALRLTGSTSDMIQVINSADLTGLTKFAISVHGHEVV